MRPTVFADVTNDMTVAREEIFGPVLSMIPFDTEEEAVEIANDTVYGLTNYVQTQDGQRACPLYTSPSPRDLSTSRMPSSA